MIKLYLGGYIGTIQGEKANLSVPRMFSASHKPAKWGYSPDIIPGESIIDSGAFTDDLDDRTTPEESLNRQLKWESEASRLWGFDWKSYALCSYDLLIDDQIWIDGKKVKRRWTEEESVFAVSETIKSAKYIDSQRKYLMPRRLVMSGQGVTVVQYRKCVEGVLEYCTTNDIFGFGGWCVLGRRRKLLPTFFAIMEEIVPIIANFGIKDVHIFGVMYEPAIAGLLYITDKYNLRLSTDSSRPIKDSICKTDEQRKKSGTKMPYWRDNVNWWINHLGDMRNSEYYKSNVDKWVGLV